MLFTLLQIQDIETHINTRMQARGAILGLSRRTAWLQLSGCASTALCRVPRARLFPSSGDAVAAALEDRGDAKRPVSQSPQSSVAEIQFLVDARSARCVQAEREAACRNSESVAVDAPAP